MWQGKPDKFEANSTIFHLAFKHSMLTLDNNLTKDAFIMIHKILSNQNLVLATKLQLQ